MDRDVDINTIQYAAFDLPEITLRLFHPRSETAGEGHLPKNCKYLEIPTEPEIHIGGRFYHASTGVPTILYFHGNGEIVADYGDLAPLYTERNLNFFPVDYRGYGRSNGIPTVTGMMRDGHYILRFARDWLRRNGYVGPLIVMGRSLGSASAIEIASTYSDQIDGLIIESGFAYALPLLRLLGVDVDAFELQEAGGMNNVEKITRYTGPLRVIHAEFDHIIPFSDGRALFEAAPSENKEFLEIKGADHNSIFYHGMQAYLDCVVSLASELATSTS